MGMNSTNELTPEECWTILYEERLGRLALAMAGVPDIVPVNYVAAKERLFLRTAPGNKLLGLAMNARIAFEVDRYDAALAESVVVHGTARVIDDSEVANEVEELGLQPWIDTDKPYVVEIVPEEITGRRYELGPRET